VCCLLSMLFYSNPLPAQDQKDYPPPGKLVDAGGHLLHLNTMGSGFPTVVFENGSGDFSFIWALVQPSVARFTGTVTYDRAGFAWSEPGPHPRSGRQIAFELHEALHHAGIKGPYILVGQSFGGFLVRIFARIYPKEVAGMVLVDALNEDSRIIIRDSPVRIRDMAKGLKAPAPVSFENVIPKGDTQKKKPLSLDTTLEFPLTRLPKEIQQWQIWAQSDRGYQLEAGLEMEWSPEDVSDMYRHRGDPAYRLGDIPLIVLTRGSGGYDGRSDSLLLETERLNLAQNLASLSSNSKWILDKNSGHNIHLEDPAQVILAIREVFDAVRLHKKLPQ
jgi:pimeloyl-ACP methyl ester carboxylesterase